MLLGALTLHAASIGVVATYTDSDIYVITERAAHRLWSVTTGRDPSMG